MRDRTALTFKEDRPDRHRRRAILATRIFLLRLQRVLVEPGCETAVDADDECEFAGSRLWIRVEVGDGEVGGGDCSASGD